MQLVTTNYYVYAWILQYSTTPALYWATSWSSKVSEHELFQEFAGLDLQNKGWPLFHTKVP